MSKRSGIMLAYPFEERRLLEPKFQWSFPVLVQPKLDGERCRVLVENGEITLRSSECNEIISIPHINRFLQKERDRRPIPLPELDGELYVPGMDFSEIHSIVSRRENLHELADIMELHLFDIVSGEAQLKRLYQLTMFDWLEPERGPVKRVSFEIAHSMSEIMSFYNQYLSEGYEGIIIRHMKAPYVRKRSRFMLKFKPKKDDYYKILEVIEAVSKVNTPLNMIGAFKCTGADGTPFKIGAGHLSHKERWDMWEEREILIGRYCHVAYQSMTSGGVPRFGLCIKVVENNPEEVSGSWIL